MKLNACPVANQKKYPFELPKLPYDNKSLEPHMTSNTFDFHHAKHHQAYVTNLNKLVEGTDMEGKSLEEIITHTHNKSDKIAIFNNAAQVWNHTFFWHSMKPKGGGKPFGELADKINVDFGSYEKFAEEFKSSGVGQFGSGWVWLVLGSDNKLKVKKTANADLPMVHNEKAILTADVWEHAYYLDYQNRRADFIQVFLDNLVNWEFAEKVFAGKCENT